MDDDTLGRAWRDDAPWELLTDLAATERFGGHPGERHAAERVREALEAAGLDTRIEPFGMQRWTRGGTRLSVDTDPARSFEAVALPYSPPADVTGQLVDAGYGTPGDCEGVDGGVAVASTATPPDADRHVHRMEKCGHAADSGARAVVFASHRPGQLPPTGALRFGEEANTPAVGVSHETGEWLRRYADRGAEASLGVDATTEAGESQNVRATLGPDTDEAVLLVAHYDAHDVGEGALDNGCGVATMVGAVRALVGVSLDRRVEVAAVGCEEVGLLGAEALAESVDTDRVRAVVNVDGAGRFRDLRAVTHGSEDLRETVERVADEVPDPVAVGEQPHPYSDHWPFLRRGIPALQLHSSRPGEDGVWERGWTHTRADTLDKADPRSVRTHTVLAALLVERVAAGSFGGIEPAALRGLLRDAGAEPGMRAAGVWPERWTG
ncbi:MAG: Zn-dependent M28 family amino/carboxypeptidase [Salinirussus sp.]|jgi:Zn-dependent M28 family amino/carboxypeptidase